MFSFNRIARDDRPYWWQSQDCVFSSKNLNQFPITCESGPGRSYYTSFVPTVVCLKQYKFACDDYCSIFSYGCLKIFYLAFYCDEKIISCKFFE